MAVRFDIDKYQKVRDSYISYLGGAKVDAQFISLYDTYKAYWQNDPEVKKAEQALKTKEAGNFIEIGDSTSSTKRTKTSGKLSAEQRITAKIERIHSQWGGNAQSTRNDAHGNLIIMRQRIKTHEAETDDKKCILLTEGLTAYIDRNGDCANLKRVKSFISCTKSNSILEKMLINLRSILSAKLISPRSYNAIYNTLCNRDRILRFEQQNRVIAASGHNYFFEVADQKTAGRLLGTVESSKEKTKKHNKHSSVWTIGSAGIPGTGKRY